ncbi:CidA/LrgA family protein [Vibrio sp. RC27]
MSRNPVKYLISMAIIFTCLYAGIGIQQLLDIALPGSIIGMLILFILLASGAVPSAQVKPSATLFIRYMMFLFVPISVGLMEHFDTLANNALPIFASAIGGSFIVLIVLALVLDRSLKRGDQ